ncbi:DNA double-strand break repair nuclease NurA [Methanolobus profundi]|uniref:NurA domain-containing protein n=1 Tax=Methanolobus profundi TaxID=487685 RepID=A0A1I4T802_9EURY|nr:DNA double-strand break repair nuclease NurA [Methanolobus profundi]SFM72723.1 NurA domain-containing protein [Methanolobus profundi]
MTLEPVHIKEIHEMVDRIDVCFKKDDNDNDDTERISNILERLRKLEYDGKVVLRSIGPVTRGKASIERMLQAEDPFPLTYSCDSGSTTAKTFDNGLYVDLCHCAMASTPSDLDIHDKRTIVAAAYTSSEKVYINTSKDWESFDNGSGRKKIIRIQPGLLKKKVTDILHDVALYLSESEHILWMLERLESESFFIMDGPIYPKRVMYWMVVNSDEVDIRTDPSGRKIIQNYIDIMDHHIEKKKPLVGFVKNPEDIQIMLALKKHDPGIDIPWLVDAQFFKNALSLERTGMDRRATGRYITYTNWFVQPNQFYEKMLKSTSPLVADLATGKFDAEDYALSFFMVFVPKLNTMFKIESPYGLVKNDDMRNMITRKVLYDLALNGIPKTLSKADTIAKIPVPERKHIIDRFRNSRIDTNYNDTRWDEKYER